MRLLFGIVLGALITVGSAYFYDAAHRPRDVAASDYRPLVNWDVVGAKWASLTARARAEWTRLAG